MIFESFHIASILFFLHFLENFRQFFDKTSFLFKSQFSIRIYVTNFPLFCTINYDFPLEFKNLEWFLNDCLQFTFFSNKNKQISLFSNKIIHNFKKYKQIHCNFNKKKSYFLKKFNKKRNWQQIFFSKKNVA